MAPSSSAEAAEADRTSSRAAITAGLSFAVAGSTWILIGHEHPGFGLCYHVPLAFAFAAWATAIILSRRGRPLVRSAIAVGIAGGLVTGRIAADWPLSGHGVLAALIAATSPWTWLRVTAFAILLQALGTKWWFDLGPTTVAYGAVAGVLTALVAGPSEEDRVKIQPGMRSYRGPDQPVG